MPITARNFKKEIGIDCRLPIEDVAQGSPFSPAAIPFALEGYVPVREGTSFRKFGRVFRPLSPGPLRLMKALAAVHLLPRGRGLHSSIPILPSSHNPLPSRERVPEERGRVRGSRPTTERGRYVSVMAKGSTKQGTTIRHGCDRGDS